MLLAILMTAVAAFHVFAAASHLGLFVGLGRKDEHISYAALCFAWAISAAGASWQMRASDAAEALSGQRIELIGIALTVLAMDRVLRSIDRKGRRRILVPVWAWVGVAANLSGLFTDTVHGRATLTVLGAAYAILSGLGCLPALIDVVRHTVRPRPKRFLIASLASWAFALAADFSFRAFQRPTYYFYEWATLVTSLLLLYALIDRFGRTHERLGERSQELRLSYDELTDVRDSLVQKEQLAAIGELSAVIAHDIRNPLAVLRNATTALRRTTLPPEDAQTLLGILDSETERLNQLIDDLLVFSKPTRPELTEINVSDVLEHTRRRILEKQPDRQIELAVEGEATIVADHPMLQKTLGTMIQAALAALPADRALRIGVREPRTNGNPLLTITLTDRLEEIQDPGTAIAPGRSGRASLGLAIAERVVQAHGGTLHIANHPDGGPHLSLTLPKTGPSL